MKRWLYLLSVLVVVSCGKIDNDQTQAVGSGKAVQKVVAGNLEYVYQYDSEGRLAMISCSDSSPELKFEYKEDGSLEVTGGNYTRAYVYGNTDELASVSYSFKGVDAGLIIFKHSDGLPISMTLTSQDEPAAATTEYLWKDGNMVKMTSLADLDVPGLYTEYTYSEIINNFEVPLPCYWSLDVFNDSYFYPMMRSKNLPQSIRLGETEEYRTFSYDFDKEGNISKVTVVSSNGDTNLSTKVYEIKY